MSERQARKVIVTASSAPIEGSIQTERLTASTGPTRYLVTRADVAGALALEKDRSEIIRDWVSGTDPLMHLAGRASVRTLPVTGAALGSAKGASGLLNSTDIAFGVARLVDAKLRRAFTEAAGEWFEDGVESRFSRSLSTLLMVYGDAAVAAMEPWLASPTSNPEVVVEAAAWLGEIDHAPSAQYRRTLLEKLLFSRRASTRVRHGAASGLASMDDPAALSAVIRARDQESNERLRHFLGLVAEQLERTRACRTS